jgi:hypothetical protein
MSELDTINTVNTIYTLQLLHDFEIAPNANLIIFWSLPCISCNGCKIITGLSAFGHPMYVISDKLEFIHAIRPDGRGKLLLETKPVRICQNIRDLLKI